MKKKRNIPFIICLIVLIAAVGALAGYHILQTQRTQVYDNIADVAENPVSDEVPEEPVSAPPETQSGPEIPIDFAALQSQNPDIYAWIRIADTEVDYPLLQSAAGDEDYYLDHTVEWQEGLPGSLYTQYSRNPDIASDPVTVIYGHNMKNGSMFGSLKHYQDQSYREAHPEVTIYTPEHIYTWRIAFAVTFDDRHLLDTYNNCETDSDCQALLDDLKSSRQLPSWMEEPFGVTAGDRMLILSTCNGNSSQRFLVGAVLTDTQ